MNIKTSGNSVDAMFENGIWTIGFCIDSFKDSMICWNVFILTIPSGKKKKEVEVKLEKK